MFPVRMFWCCFDAIWARLVRRAFWCYFWKPWAPTCHLSEYFTSQCFSFIQDCAKFIYSKGPVWLRTISFVP